MKQRAKTERFVFVFFVYLITATVCWNVSAELVQADLIPGSGDGLLVRDTDSGSDWLRLTETQGLSVVDIIDEGVGGYDDLVTRANPEPAHHHLQRIRAVRHSDAVAVPSLRPSER